MMRRRVDIENERGRDEANRGGGGGGGVERLRVYKKKSEREREEEKRNEIYEKETPNDEKLGRRSVGRVMPRWRLKRRRVVCMTMVVVMQSVDARSPGIVRRVFGSERADHAFSSSSSTTDPDTHPSTQPTPKSHQLRISHRTRQEAPLPNRLDLPNLLLHLLHLPFRVLVHVQPNERQRDPHRLYWVNRLTEPDDSHQDDDDPLDEGGDGVGDGGGGGEDGEGEDVLSEVGHSVEDEVVEDFLDPRFGSGVDSSMGIGEDG